MLKIKEYNSDNLIYNRFDMIYPNQYHTLEFEYDSIKYEIMIHKEKECVEVNLWGKELPDIIWNKMIEQLFEDDTIYAIKLIRVRNQYKKFLEKTNDICVPLPSSFDVLMNRIERRDRATIRRKLRWLGERIGSLEIDIFAKKDIPDYVVNTYFSWKKNTHGTEYGLTPEEYLSNYYVTDAMLMRAGETDVAVAFFCQVNDVVFFENFSYNTQLSNYSPGLLMYVKFMEELIQRKCKYLYLGGGGYIYKKRFAAEHSVAYSGMIYRREIVDALNSYFVDRGIKTVAFYGYGVCGHSFYQLSKNLDIEVHFGIDKNAEDYEQSEITLYRPNDSLPETDAGLITLNKEDSKVENFMKDRFSHVFYWNNILNTIIDDYRRSVDATS